MPALPTDPDYRIELIRAKVPILRFLSVSTGIQVDLNCNNLVGIRNTHLLQCYSGGELSATHLLQCYSGGELSATHTCCSATPGVSYLQHTPAAVLLRG